jgi:hypothetical protein
MGRADPALEPLWDSFALVERTDPRTAIAWLVPIASARAELVAARGLEWAAA